MYGMTRQSSDGRQLASNVCRIDGVL